MAKMKTFLVEVEITQRVTVSVQARRPQGAVDKLMTRDGWRAANMYCDESDPVHGVFSLDDNRCAVVRVEDANY